MHATANCPTTASTPATRVAVDLAKDIFELAFADAGGRFGNHIDNAVRYDRSQPDRAEPVRTDVSVTLFLSPPEDYDGGELLIEDTFGSQRVKLSAGHAVLYPASITTVTGWQRLAAFFWAQSMVRDDGERRLLFDLDLSIRQLTRDLPEHPSLLGLTGDLSQSFEAVGRVVGMSESRCGEPCGSHGGCGLYARRCCLRDLPQSDSPPRLAPTRPTSPSAGP